MSSLYCGLTAGYSRQACCSEFWAKTIITSSCSPRCLWVFLLLGHTLASVQLTVPKKPRAFPTGLLPKQLIPSLCHLEGFICPRTFVLALVHKVPTAPFPQSLNCRMTALWLSMGAAPTPLLESKANRMNKESVSASSSLISVLNKTGPRTLCCTTSLVTGLQVRCTATALWPFSCVFIHFLVHPFFFIQRPKLTVENRVENIAEVKLSYVWCSFLAHKSTHFIMKGDKGLCFTAEGKQLGQAWFALDKSLLSISEHLHLHAHRDVLYEDSFCGFAKYLMGRSKGDGASFFLVKFSDRVRDNRHKLKYQKCPLNVNKTPFLGGWDWSNWTTYWNRLSR